MCHFFHEFLLIISHIPKVFVPVSSWKSSFLFFVFSPETGDSSQTEYINVCAQPVVWASGSPSVKQTNALGYSPATAVYSHCTPSTEGGNTGAYDLNIHRPTLFLLWYETPHPSVSLCSAVHGKPVYLTFNWVSDDYLCPLILFNYMVSTVISFIIVFCVELWVINYLIIWFKSGFFFLLIWWSLTLIWVFLMMK